MFIGNNYFGVNYYIDTLLSKVTVGENISKEEAYISATMQDELNIENIALFGVDNSYKASDRFDDERSDAMKIISLNKSEKTILITSVERDVVVCIPGDRQEYGHFNWAYWFGGPKLAVQTLNYSLDLDITKYITISFGALEKIVNKVGRVEIELTEAEINQRKQGTLGINGEPSVYTLSGRQALVYCRLRYIDSDFTRMERQNNVIKAVLEKIKGKDIFFILDLVNELIPYINTNLTNDEIKSYITTILSYDLSNIQQFKEPRGEYEDIQTCPRLGGYIVRSYSEMVKNLHFNI